MSLTQNIFLMLNYLITLPTGTLASGNRRNIDSEELIDWTFCCMHGGTTSGTSQIFLKPDGYGTFINGFEIRDPQRNLIFVRLKDAIPQRNRRRGLGYTANGLAI